MLSRSGVYSWSYSPSPDIFASNHPMYSDLRYLRECHPHPRMPGYGCVNISCVSSVARDLYSSAPSPFPLTVSSFCVWVPPLVPDVRRAVFSDVIYLCGPHQSCRSIIWECVYLCVWVHVYGKRRMFMCVFTYMLIPASARLAHIDRGRDITLLRDTYA